MKQWLARKLGLEELQTQALTLEVTNKRLIDELRFMDQQIWNMSQQPDWNGMRPFYQDALLKATARKEEASERIGKLVEVEIRRTYGR